MYDETEQEDEIMALESIYDKDVFNCDVSKKPYSGEIVVHFRGNPGPYDIFCQGEILYQKYLSPIVMQFSLPPDYPSLSPPNVILSCIWLSSEQLEVLSQKLFDQWDEICGVVLFAWINFLQAEFFGFLEINFPINLSQEDFLNLNQHCLLREETDFNQDMHECPLCFCQKAGIQCTKLGDCGHIFCNECLSSFLLFHITEGSVKAIECPAEDCKAEVYPNVIKGLVSKAAFERYDKLVLQNALDTMSDVEYCPRRRCGHPVIIDCNESFAVCQACRFVFCLQCKATYHGVDACKEVEEGEENVKTKKVLAPVVKVGGKQLEGTSVKRRMNAAKEDNQSLKWIKKNTKKCPGCNVQIEKNMGCNKMHCGSCNISFCWLCLSRLAAKNPYNHFSNKDSPCNKKLFQVNQKKNQ